MNRAARRALGQYFTPRQVAAFAIRAVQELAGASLARAPRVIDPACGEGVFLRETLSCGLVGAGAGPETLIGLDVDPSLQQRWREGGLEPQARLRVADGLLDDSDAGVLPASFDLVVGNPPFGRDCLAISAEVVGDVSARRRAVIDHYDCWKLGAALSDGETEATGRQGDGETGRPVSPLHPLAPSPRRLGLPVASVSPSPRRLDRFPAEMLFVERFLQLARPGGWLAVVVPEGLLGNPRVQPFRDWLATKLIPRAVVLLPRALFGAASAQTALLVGQKVEVRGWGLGVGGWRAGTVGDVTGHERIGYRSGEDLPACLPMTAPASDDVASLGPYLAVAFEHVTQSHRPSRGTPQARHSSSSDSLTGGAGTVSPPGTIQPPTPNPQPLTPKSVVAARGRMLYVAPALTELRRRPWSPNYWDPDIADALSRLEATVFPLVELGDGGSNFGFRISDFGFGNERSVPNPKSEIRNPKSQAGFLRTTTYGAVGSRAFAPTGVHYLTTKNLTPTGIDVARCERYVAPGGPNDPPRSRLRPGDILLSNSGVASLGRPAFFLEEGDYNVSQHINRLEVEGIDPCFLTAYLHTEYARAQMRRLASGTGAAGLSYDDIRSLRVPVLPPQDQIAARIAFLEMHSAHREAMALRPNHEAQDQGEAAAAFQACLERARGLLNRLVGALEQYIVAPDAGGGFQVD